MTTRKPSTARHAAAYLIAATAGIGLLTFLPASVTTTANAPEVKSAPAPVVHTESAPVPIGSTCEQSVAASLAWYTGPITDDTVTVLHDGCAHFGSDAQAVIFEDGSWTVTDTDAISWRGCASKLADCAD
jgi:hypothetical protein